MNEKEKVQYLQEKGWTPHPKDPDRFWQSPNHKNTQFTYGTDKAYASQIAFEEGSTLKEVEARTSVSKRMFYVTVVNEDNEILYLGEHDYTMHEREASKYVDLKSAVEAANLYMMSPDEGFNFYGFEAVKKDG